MPPLGWVFMQTDEYRKMAAVEDDMWYYQTLHAHFRRVLMTRLAGRSVRILDAGCGTGGLIRRLQPLNPGWDWTGVDLHPEACRLARERTKAEIRQGDLTRLPFAEATFDAVVSADVLYHIADDTQALRELMRVLRPGGILVVNVPAYPWLWSYHDVAVESQRRYRRRELTSKLRQTGLRVEQVTHWNLLLLPLIVVRRKWWPAPAAGSDVEAYSPGLNRLLKTLLRGETVLLRLCGGLPAGSSLLSVAQKPA
jgi:SAM-dependent methyltransferase